MNTDRKKRAATHCERAKSEPGSGDGRPSDDQVRVLVVDDDPLNTKLVLAQLEQGGYEVFSVESGEAALEALASSSYSLVLMDCQLQGMDGWATTREIRRREGSGRHSIIVGFSSNTAVSARAKCLEAGMDTYIARPVTTSELIAQLGRLSYPNGSVAALAAITARSDASEAAASQSLDTNVLIELAMLPGADGGSLLHELTRIFLRNLPAMVRELSFAGGASSAEIARSAHRLKSASTTIGGKRLAALCDSIEQVPGVEASILEQMIIEAREESARLAEMLKKIPLD